MKVLVREMGVKALPLLVLGSWFLVLDRHGSWFMTAGLLPCYSTGSTLNTPCFALMTASGPEDAELRLSAERAGQLRKEEELEKRRQAAAQKEAAKASERAQRAQHQEQKVREEAAVTTAGLNVQWDKAFATVSNKEGEARNICFDLWRASRPGTDGPFPVVVWLHGGGWKFGTHHTMPAFLHKFVDAGFAIASVGYRKSGEAAFPANLHDCKAAVRWLRANGQDFGLSKERIAVLGNSAGAHLASLLGTTAGIAELEGGHLGHEQESSAVDAVVAIAGPADLWQTCGNHDSPKTLEAQLLGAAVGTVPDLARFASPVTHAAHAAALPPFLLLHGDQDEDVPFEQSELLLQALLSSGSEASLIRIAGGKHPNFGDRLQNGADVSLESAWDAWSEALEQSAVRFLQRHIC
ncbi:unnamed protein product [Polarella glacialis]|uniref:BD-FAE-like domain-containing protein n=2 Tax=Polarella glacialis TaxID=89957 RepID=A0A813LVH5_POLGL|nr:unnamed protein product [Polarella glacialis]